MEAWQSVQYRHRRQTNTLSKTNERQWSTIGGTFWAIVSARLHYRSSPEPLQVGHVTSFFPLQTEHGWWRTMSVVSSPVPWQARHGTVPEPLHSGHSIVVS